MLIFVALVLLFVLPSPWNWLAFLGVTLLWVGELGLWNRTVRKRRKTVGAETLLGRTAVVSTACRPVGQVKLDGELWEARCAAGADVGDEVRVVGREKLTLVVEPVAPT